jgi:hypothetical protein
MSISSVTSEALQLKLRELLPSQQGFGTDLSASDTIIPIIDLTAAAEGSSVGVNLQTALAYGSQTAFDVTNATTDIITTTGFYRIVGCISIKPSSSTNKEASINATDGVTPKKIFHVEISDNNNISNQVIPFDLVVFVNTGESIQAQASSSSFITGSTRQIADVNGTLVQPVGFTPQ